MGNCRRTLVTVIAFTLLGIGLAHASPGVELVCFDRDFRAQVGFEENWSNAYIDTPADGQLVLPVTNDGANGPFEFSDGTWRLTGFLPEGQLNGPDGVTAGCYQTAENQRMLAFYGSETQRWAAYADDGRASGNVRSRPSVLAEQVGNLNDDAVVILSNTDVFQDGFFWYKIEYGNRERGYIWGALLCTNSDNPELNAVLRRCG